MRTAGITMCVIGVLWLISALFMPRTIQSQGSLRYVSDVVNFDLVDRRRDHITLASLVIIIGVNLFTAARGSAFKTSEESVVKQYRSEALLNPPPTIERDKFGIERREGYYAIAGYHYDTYEEALAHAKANPR